jgi:Cyclin, N-terminal domain
LYALCSHLYQAETGCRPSTKYLNDQHGPAFQPDQYLDVSMRTTAVSWLVEVGMDFGLHQESLFLAVALLDRYLTATEVSIVLSAQLERASTISQPADLKICLGIFCISARTARTSGAPSGSTYHMLTPRRLLAVQGVARNDLQLISVACMLVAAKHEEVSWAAQVCHAAANEDSVSCHSSHTSALSSAEASSYARPQMSYVCCRSAIRRWPSLPALQMTASRCCLVRLCAAL